MTKLLLIRHGESEANREDRFSGQIDVALQERGIQQAQKTACYILEHYSVDKLYSSDLLRASQTGKIIADLLHVDMVTHQGLREINAGEWEGKKFTELIAEYAKDYSVWLNDIGNCICTNGESVKQLSKRFFATLSEIVEENNGKTVVVSTHATPIRCVQCALSGKPLELLREIPWVSNASVTEVCCENDNWTLIRVGYDAHLAELKTYPSANV